MTQYATLEVWVMVDNDGNHVASHQEDQLLDLYEEHVQGLSDAEGTRRVKVLVKVPLPTTLDATAELAENAVASAKMG